MTADPREAKRAWRRRLRAAWQAASPADLARWAAQALLHLTALDAWQRADVVFCYVSVPGEFPTRTLIEAAWAGGKRVAVPRILGGGAMEARAVDAWDDLRPGAFDIPEPDPDACPRVEPSVIDLCIVPGLAFDRRCARLGRGGGYYDRYLPQLRPDAARVGWIPSEFVFDELPAEPHDACVDLVVTEKGMVTCGRGS